MTASGPVPPPDAASLAADLGEPCTSSTRRASSTATSSRPTSSLRPPADARSHVPRGPGRLRHRLPRRCRPRDHARHGDRHGRLHLARAGARSRADPGVRHLQPRTRPARGALGQTRVRAADAGRGDLGATERTAGGSRRLGVRLAVAADRDDRDRPGRSPDGARGLGRAAARSMRRAGRRRDANSSAPSPQSHRRKRGRPTGRPKLLPAMPPPPPPVPQRPPSTASTAPTALLTGVAVADESKGAAPRQPDRRSRRRWAIIGASRRGRPGRAGDVVVLGTGSRSAPTPPELPQLEEPLGTHLQELMDEVTPVMRRVAMRSPPRSRSSVAALAGCATDSRRLCRTDAAVRACSRPSSRSPNPPPPATRPPRSRSSTSCSSKLDAALAAGRGER